MKIIFSGRTDEGSARLMMNHIADGAEASAIVFSIINTAAANNLNPYKYLHYIFCQLPNINFTLNPGLLEEYLPWAEKV